MIYQTVTPDMSHVYIHHPTSQYIAKRNFKIVESGSTAVGMVLGLQELGVAHMLGGTAWGAGRRWEY